MNKRKKVKIIISIAIIIVFLLFVSSIFAITNMFNENYMNGVWINNINISNLSKTEAYNKLKEYQENLLKEVNIVYKDDYNSVLSLEQIELSFNIEEILNEAYKVGRSGNMVSNNYAILKSILFKTKFSLDFKYNEEKFNYLISDITKKLPGIVIDSSYYIENDFLVIYNGKNGILADELKLKEQILTNISNNINLVEIPVKEAEAKKIDITKIYKEIFKNPENAYIIDDPFEVVKDIDGIDFAISFDEINEMLKEYKEEYFIPIKITKAEVKIEDLNLDIFPDLLSSYSTIYDTNNNNRTTNLTLAAEKIDNTIIMPGEVFSYNKVVGQRTIAAGYKEAAIYANGKIVNGIGGGICQVSSTIYNTALLANLEIVERRNHQFTTYYVPKGQDATVVYGAIDFKFKNNRTFPIKINVVVESGVCKIDFYGIKEKQEYTVKIETKVLSVTPFKTHYINDSKIEKGKAKRLQAGMNGYSTETYRIVKLGNVQLSKTLISTDSYNALDETIAIGQ